MESYLREYVSFGVDRTPVITGVVIMD